VIYGPKKNAAFAVYLPLVTKGATDCKDAPTIATGDFQVKKDAGAFGNITTPPALDAAGEKVVKVTFSAAEMNADVVVLRGIDQTNPKEWEDTGLVILTTAQGVGLQSGDAYARLGAPAGASTAADVAAVKADTAAVKAKTDALPPDPADASDLAALLAAVQADTDNIQTRLPAALTGAGNLKADALVVSDKTGYSLTAGERDAIAAALLDLAAGVETNLTLRQELRLLASVLLSKNSGGGTATNTFRDFNDIKDRIVETVDSDGNRTAFATRDGN